MPQYTAFIAALDQQSSLLQSLDEECRVAVDPASRASAGFSNHSYGLVIGMWYRRAALPPINFARTGRGVDANASAT
jgi:hypothetical protein